MNFVTNVLRKYIQNEPQAVIKEEIVVESPNKENGFAVGCEKFDENKHDVVYGNKSTENETRLSVLKLFDPLYSESSENIDIKIEVKQPIKIESNLETAQDISPKELSKKCKSTDILDEISREESVTAKELLLLETAIEETHQETEKISNILPEISCQVPTKETVSEKPELTEDKTEEVEEVKIEDRQNDEIYEVNEIKLNISNTDLAVEICREITEDKLPDLIKEESVESIESLVLENNTEEAFKEIKEEVSSEKIDSADTLKNQIIVDGEYESPKVKVDENKNFEEIYPLDTQIDSTENTNGQTYCSKMTDLSEKLNEQQQENSELKLQLNASQQAKASLELEIRQKEEIIIKTQAEALKNEQVYKQELKQLREELKENSKLIEKDSYKELEEQLKEVKAREAKDVAELNNYQKIMDEYENTIAARFADYQKLKEEHETATRHLANIELAFSDVHQKYERTKALLEGFKSNEETLTFSLQACEKTCKQHEEKYESLKAHAKAQIEKSNKEILSFRDRYEMDINKMKAIIKRLEIKCSSLEVSLQQKTEECAALSALFEEVTRKKV